jgi:hypothetical protein
MWNDWNGSIPVFHAQIGKGRIASTLEPAVVAAAGYTPNDFFLPGLVSMLINGHYLGDWSLFKGMKIIPPDCVDEWNDQGFRWKRLWAVNPTDDRWERGWDDLIDEMYALSHRAVAKVLKTQSSWILPLSGGIDSRLTAAVGEDLGTDLRAYTYGHNDWDETVYARQVAGVLGLPWQRVSIEPDYLVRYTRMWLDWFGSALHCHGMYQMPFLATLDGKESAPILQGYMGDPLAGNHVLGLISTHNRSDEVKPVTANGVHWPLNSLNKLLPSPYTQETLELVRNKTTEEIEQIPGAWYQRLMFLDFWNRQRLFVYYQSMMYDYYRGVATPFFNRNYAQFCLSLPRLALEGRRLQKEMLRRYYPTIATIGGTFGDPLVQSRFYLAKKAVAQRLPRFLCKGSFQEFSPAGNTIQINALRKFGGQALWPLNKVRQSLGDWFNLDVLEKTYQDAAAGDEIAYNRLRPIQAIAWHFVQK